MQHARHPCNTTAVFKSTCQGKTSTESSLKKMELTLANYGIGAGAALFPFFESYYHDASNPFVTGNYDFTKWPTVFLQWIRDDVRNKFPTFDDSWMTTLRVNQKKVSGLANTAKQQLHIGYRINKTTDETKSVLVNHLNKHWPMSADKFKSGQTKSGLLKVMRKNLFYQTVAVNRASDNARQHYLRIRERNLGTNSCC